jgi:hypothetical protein
VPGLTRAPSTAVAVIGAAYVEGASPEPQPSAVSGSLNAELSTTTRETGVPAGSAATTCAARSATVAAPGYSRDGASRDSVTSPLPTRTTSPGVLPSTTVVASVSAGSRVVSAATAVSSLAVDAGVAGEAASRS